MESVFAAIDGLVAPPPLRWTIEEGGRLQELEDRAAYLQTLAQENKDGETICNGRLDAYVGVAYLNLSDVIGPGHSPVVTVRVEFSPDFLGTERLLKLMTLVGDGLDAWSGECTPSKAFLTLAKLFQSEPDFSEETQRDLLAQLPRIRNPLRLLPGPEVPMQLGWLNYWSPATCKLSAFPQEHQDEEWLKLSHETPRGGWVVRITADPLDISRREHVEALVRAYKRFSGVGLRREG